MSYKVIMSFADLIRISFFSFNSYKLRIFLTMIGIIISISSVVVILSIGDGLKKEISRPMEYDSPNKFNVNFEPNDNNFEFGLNKPFDKIDIYYINNIEGVEKAESTKGIGGLNLTSVQINYFDKNVFTIVTDYDYEEKELDILYGRSFVENEKTDKKIVLEFETAKTIFNSPKEAIGRGVEINRENYEVIGVLGKVSGFSLTSNSSYVLKEAIEDMNIESDITGIDIYIKPDYDVNEVFVDIAKS